MMKIIALLVSGYFLMSHLILTRVSRLALGQCALITIYVGGSQLELVRRINILAHVDLGGL